MKETFRQVHRQLAQAVKQLDGEAKVLEKQLKGFAHQFQKAAGKGDAGSLANLQARIAEAKKQLAHERSRVLRPRTAC